MSNNHKDNLYSQPREAITDFVFDESVVRVFSDMISRSVPGYSTILSMIPVLARKYVQDDSNCYDLGCSLGASTLAMRHSINANNVRIISIDNSQAMIDQCRNYIDQDHGAVPVDLLCSDIKDVELNNASIVVMNFTLQFIKQDERLALIKKIYDSLIPGGAFLLSEKIVFENADQQDWMTDLHHDFKKANGYSDLEISQKRSALENVLVGESIDQHHNRLHQAGFNKVTTWFQCFNFVSILAVK